MKILRKKLIGKVWKYFAKTSKMEFLSVEFSDCNFTIKRTHHIFFLEYIPKISCLKKNILRRNSMADQQLDKVAGP